MPCTTLARLLEPRSIAVVGASGDPTRIGGRPLRYLLEGGFEGSLYAVNPRRRTVQGLPAYPGIEDLPAAPDLAIVAVPGPAVADTLAACARRGVGAAVVFSAGFAESGAAGARRQARLSALARASGMRILGPNCLGLFNARTRVFATFSATLESARPRPGPVALVSQSGAYGAHVAFLARRRGIDVGYWVTTGNECDVTLEECLEWMAGRPEVGVLVAYAEGVRDGDRLGRALARARRLGKPVVFTKVGRSEVGARAARSHTAALTGADAVYDAVLREHGAHRAADTEEMLDVAYAASRAGPSSGRRVGLLTISGGVGIQMADAAVAHRLEVPSLPGRVRARLRRLLPFAATANPVDVTAQVFNRKDLVGPFLETMLESGRFDALVAFFTYVAGAPFMAGVLRDAFAAARRRFPRRPIALAIIAPEEVVRGYEDAGCLVFEEPARAVRAVAALARFGEAFAEPPRAPPALSGAPPLPPGALDEWEARRWLAAAGVPVIPGRLATSAESAARAARALGLPVALKICSPDLAHKSEAGAVLLGVPTVSAVREGYRRLRRAVAAAAPEARVRGMIVSPMAPPGVEVVVGVHRDPTFGPVVMVGLGGLLVETLGDVAHALAPLDATRARRLLESLRGFPALAGARGRPACDLRSLCDALVRLAGAAAATPGLGSVEVNPLLVGPRGSGVMALDALLVRAEGGSGAAPP